MHEYSPGEFMVSLSPLQSTRMETETLKGGPQKVREFIVMGYSNILSDLAKGSGDYLDSLMGLLNVPADGRAEAIKKVRALSEAYTNILDFADHVVEFYSAPQPETARVPEAPVDPRDWDKLQSAAPKTQYEFLARLDRDAAKKITASMTHAQIVALGDYMLQEKGQKSATSWIFKINQDLDDRERDFVSWYLKEYTDYKPRF